MDTLWIREGTRLIKVLRDSGHDILYKCATKATCARCLVLFHKGEPDVYTLAEQKLIKKWILKNEINQIRIPGVRASCQIRIMINFGDISILFRESESNIPLSKHIPLESIEPEAIWINGKPKRHLQNS